MKKKKKMKEQEENALQEIWVCSAWGGGVGWVLRILKEKKIKDCPRYAEGSKKEERLQ